MQKISQKLETAQSTRFQIRGGDLGRQLSTATLLIASGVETPVFKVKIGGFDTHEDQIWRHRDLLRDLSRALDDFASELRRIDEWDNTIVMTYSEFGRRAVENFTQGTDHGTAAPHFIAGGKVKGSLYGSHPNLGDLIEGDLRYTMDYRSVYDLILHRWFEIDQNRFSEYRAEPLNGLI